MDTACQAIQKGHKKELTYSQRWRGTTVLLMKLNLHCTITPFWDRTFFGSMCPVNKTLDVWGSLAHTVLAFWWLPISTCTCCNHLNMWLLFVQGAQLWFVHLDCERMRMRFLVLHLIDVNWRAVGPESTNGCQLAVLQHLSGSFSHCSLLSQEHASVE